MLDAVETNESLQATGPLQTFDSTSRFFNYAASLIKVLIVPRQCELDLSLHIRPSLHFQLRLTLPVTRFTSHDSHVTGPRSKIPPLPLQDFDVFPRFRLSAILRLLGGMFINSTDVISYK